MGRSKVPLGTDTQYSINKSRGWQWAYQRLSDERLTIREVEDIIYNEEYPIGMPGWKQGMEAALKEFKEERDGFVCEHCNGSCEDDHGMPCEGCDGTGVAT